MVCGAARSGACSGVSDVAVRSAVPGRSRGSAGAAGHQPDRTLVRHGGRRSADVSRGAGSHGGGGTAAGSVRAASRCAAGTTRALAGCHTLARAARSGEDFLRRRDRDQLTPRAASLHAFWMSSDDGEEAAGDLTLAPRAIHDRWPRSRARFGKRSIPKQRPSSSRSARYITRWRPPHVDGSERLRMPCPVVRIRPNRTCCGPLCAPISVCGASSSMCTARRSQNSCASSSLC